MIYLKRIGILFQWVIRVVLFIILGAIVAALIITQVIVSIMGLFLNISLQGEYYYKKYRSIISIYVIFIASWDICLKQNDRYEKDKLSSFYERLFSLMLFFCFDYGRV